MGKTETAEDAFVRNTIEARELVAKLQARLDDVTCPGEDFTPNWAHVGTLAKVVRDLTEIDMARWPYEHRAI